jgi:hypothetical protein
MRRDIERRLDKLEGQTPAGVCEACRGVFLILDEHYHPDGFVSHYTDDSTGQRHPGPDSVERCPRCGRRPPLIVVCLTERDRVAWGPRQWSAGTDQR